MFSFSAGFSAPLSSFILSKLAFQRAKVESVQIDASTMIFNDQSPKDNLVFDETLLFRGPSRYLLSIKIDRERADRYGLWRFIKLNIGENECFVEGSYVTLNIKHPVSEVPKLLFSGSVSEISSIVRNARIDTDIIGLGRLSGSVSRIYGAKELNTYRKSGPSILLQDKVGILEEKSFYEKIKPQIWFDRDSFFIARFISRKEFGDVGIVSDVRFSNYREIFPRLIDVYHNERLYARTVIKKFQVNPKIRKKVFLVDKNLKKRTYEKMINNLSENSLRIFQFVRYYR